MMDPHSILAGKTYRTADNVVRRVTRIDGDIVRFNEVVATPGMIGRHDELELGLSAFAEQVEGEVGP